MKTIRKTVYIAADGKAFDTSRECREYEKFCQLHTWLAERMHKHYDAEEVATQLLSEDSPFILVPRTGGQP